MAQQLTESDGLTALRDHVLEKAAEARRRYGEAMDGATVLRLLEDRSVVRYPVVIRFEGWHLESHEFAYLEAIGEHPAEGFYLFMHPTFEARRDLWPAVVAYFLPSVNYGEIVSHEEAELFGATLLGIGQEEYYQQLCRLADGLPEPMHP